MNILLIKEQLKEQKEKDEKIRQSICKEYMTKFIVNIDNIINPSKIKNNKLYFPIKKECGKEVLEYLKTKDIINYGYDYESDCVELLLDDNNKMRARTTLFDYDYNNKNKN
jgi:hypothetical protein